METHDGIFIGLELAYNHADDTAIWCRLMVLRRDTLLDFLEWKARQLLHNGSFPLELLSFSRKA